MMRYIFAAGGTAGHINPALAAAAAVRAREPDAQILFIGTAKKMEARLVPAAGFDFQSISVSGFQRKLTLKNLLSNIIAVYQVFASSVKVRRILRSFRPDVVVGFGGYVSGPVVRAAAKMGIKTALHEQNAYPGVTNKMLAGTVDVVMLTDPGAKSRMNCKNEPVVTGFPVREAILNADRAAARKALGYADDQTVIFSFGGSLGARAINEAMAELIPALYDGERLCFIHGYGQYGKWFPDRLREKGVDPDGKNMLVSEYINNMDECLAAADIVICRAGAGTLAELEAAGKASVLIPSPNVAENHQYHNAMSLVERGAARIIEEKELTGERLLAEVRALIDDPAMRAHMQQSAAAMSKRHAEQTICGILCDLAASNKTSE